MDLFSRQVAAAALVDGQHFTLPGFGTLEGAYVSARIDHASRKVDPPNLAVHWHVVVDEEAQTFAELLTRTGATSFEAEATELAWTAALTSGEDIEVGDLGTLRRDPLTKHVNFFPNERALAQAYWGGGAVAVEPLARREAVAHWEPVAAAKSASQPPPPVAAAAAGKPRRSPVPYLLGAATLLLIGGLVWYLVAQRGGGRHPGEQHVLQVSQERLNRSPHDPTPVELAESDVAAVPAPVDELDFAISDPEEEVAPAAFDPAALAGDDEDFSQPYRPESFDAVIIVGSFTSSRYTDRLQEKILAAGLVPYVDHPGSLDRVGVAFSANSQAEVMAMLERMRLEFGEDSWILD